MAGRECYHCKKWIADGEEHDCWTTTEAALTRELSDDLRDAWERLRETAVSFGDQRFQQFGPFRRILSNVQKTRSEPETNTD